MVSFSLRLARSNDVAVPGLADLGRADGIEGDVLEARASAEHLLEARHHRLVDDRRGRLDVRLGALEDDLVMHGGDQPGRQAGAAQAVVGQRQRHHQRLGAAALDRHVQRPVGLEAQVLGVRIDVVAVHPPAERRRRVLLALGRGLGPVLPLHHRGPHATPAIDQLLGLLDRDVGVLGEALDAGAEQEAEVERLGEAKAGVAHRIELQRRRQRLMRVALGIALAVGQARRMLEDVEQRRLAGEQGGGAQLDRRVVQRDHAPARRCAEDATVGPGRQVLAVRRGRHAAGPGAAQREAEVQPPRHGRDAGHHLVTERRDQRAQRLGPEILRHLRQPRPAACAPAPCRTATARPCSARGQVSSSVRIDAALQALAELLLLLGPQAGQSR